MAYCVHCGVKLGDSERRCPLCGTEVLDPSQPRDPESPRPYPGHTPEQEIRRSKRFLLSLAALLLLLPAALCLVLDFLAGGGITWSVYAASAMGLLFVAVAVPVAVARCRFYWTLGTSFLCLSAYLFLVERLSHSGQWFLPIVLPAVALCAAMAAAMAVLYRRKRLNKLTLLASLFAAVAVECLAVEWLCERMLSGDLLFLWSPYVLAPCLFISLILFFINGNRAVREEVRRRVHF